MFDDTPNHRRMRWTLGAAAALAAAIFLPGWIWSAKAQGARAARRDIAAGRLVLHEPIASRANSVDELAVQLARERYGVELCLSFPDQCGQASFDRKRYAAYHAAYDRVSEAAIRTRHGMGPNEIFLECRARVAQDPNAYVQKYDRVSTDFNLANMGEAGS